MNKYYVVQLRFSTRKYINNKLRRQDRGSSAIHGIVHIIIDKKSGIVKKMIPEIIEGEYRVTDLDLVETKGHYLASKNVRDFREWMSWKLIKKKKEKVDRVILSKQEINKMNEFFWNENQTTFLTALSFLVGSNISGVETKKINSPIVIDDKEYLKDYWNFNFTNSFKTFSKMQNNLFIQKELLQEICFEQYFEKFPIVKMNKKGCIIKIKPQSEFIKFNKWNLLGTDKFEILITNIEKQLILSKEEAYKEKDKTIINKLMNLNQKETKTQKQALNNMLRVSFARNVQIEFQKESLSQRSLMDSCSSHIAGDQYQNAHIISFALLFNEGWKEKDVTKIQDAISASNCLRLSPNDHSNFDKDRMTIDSGGNVYEYKIENKEWIKSERLISNKDLKDKNRKQFLAKNYNNFQNTGKNIH